MEGGQQKRKGCQTEIEMEWREGGEKEGESDGLERKRDRWYIHIHTHTCISIHNSLYKSGERETGRLQKSEGEGATSLSLTPREGQSRRQRGSRLCAM